jgi:chromosome segregation ATPase
LRDALGARVAELAEVVAILEARDADLAAARAQVASLTSEAQQWRTDAERAAVEQQAVVARLRGALDARSAELDGLVGTLQARDTDLAAAQAQIAALTAVAEHMRAEREATLASWTWKAGQPFRLAGSATRAVITALRPGRPPAT